MKEFWNTTECGTWLFNLKIEDEVGRLTATRITDDGFSSFDAKPIEGENEKVIIAAAEVAAKEKAGTEILLVTINAANQKPYAILKNGKIAANPVLAASEDEALDQAYELLQPGLPQKASHAPGDSPDWQSAITVARITS
ncbi:hypothetical protein PDESU_03318 [Pontiella desulfatans]|uniref:Uncharacterized protein n=1 Tax=Pontiella desulfatans TaxID=2750659 RepID=A0A6C2U4J0_PONDE|nr:hypothetical protein [Pontiella desulfatans]VGO14749.1 hypothetical protein PDESU_03318 [Pontiella desulfatans]